MKRNLYIGLTLVALLAGLGSPPETRLACQAVVRPGDGVVRLRWGT